MHHAVTLVFVGRLPPASFSEFVAHRARRLSVDAELRAVASGRIEVAVSGEPDLIDAFEMACSLGPIDCLVLDTFRRDQPRARSVAARALAASS